MVSIYFVKKETLKKGDDGVNLHDVIKAYGGGSNDLFLFGCDYILNVVQRRKHCRVIFMCDNMWNRVLDDPSKYCRENNLWTS